MCNHSRSPEHRKVPWVRVHNSAGKNSTSEIKLQQGLFTPRTSARVHVPLGPAGPSQSLSLSLVDRPFSSPVSNGTISVFHTLGSKFSVPVAV